MKRIIISVISLTIIFSSLFSIFVTANEKFDNWYCLKKNGRTEFPPNANFVSQHGGYFIDSSEKAQQEKIVYFTFDAGYENGNVSKILDILKEKNVKASFFIISYLIKHNLDLVKRMGDEGHTVCNHSDNHKNMTILTDEEMSANLKRLEDLYREKTGRNMSKFFRFPEGKYNERTLLNLEKDGYSPVFWSFAYADWDNSKQPDKNKSVALILKRVQPGDIILLHPTSKTNTEVLPILIDELRQRGYHFGNLSDL